MALIRRKWLSRTQKEALDCYVFISPAVVGLLLFMLGPIVFSAYISFTDYDILGSPRRRTRL